MKKYGIKVPRRRGGNNFCTKSVKHRKYPNLIQDLQISYEHQVWCSRCELAVLKPRLTARTQALVDLLWALENHGSIPTKIIEAAKKVLSDH